VNRFDWLQGFVGNLRAQGIRTSEREPRDLGRAQLLVVKAADWGQVAGQAARDGLRFAGVWAEQREEGLVVNASLARRGEHLVLRTALDISASVLPSYTPHYPAADRMERHVRDLFSIRFVDHPDPRRWTRHQAWPETSFPLHKDYPVHGKSQAATPADSDYPFIQSHGAGVCEIPVGPVHAGIIEPGHFRFQAVGETVLHLEERLGYVHKGIEKIAEGRDPEGLVRLAGRVSGDSTVSHAWAACMAMETVADVDPPPRALALRAVMAERERIANHLGDIGAICNDVSFTFAHYQFSRLRELWQRASAGAFGHRLMMDQVVPAG
jgi:Ni,Fe-hydrogenase III large subunit